MATGAKAKTRTRKKQRQFVVDADGRRMAVILSMREYKALLEAAEDLADLRAADEARAEGGKGVPLEVVEARLRAQGKLR